MIKPCLHFIGFRVGALDAPGTKDARFLRAVRLFGAPDFVHYGWDIRAQQEIAEGDVAVFAVGTEADQPSPYSYDDSAVKDV